MKNILNILLLACLFSTSFAQKHVRFYQGFECDTYHSGDSYQAYAPDYYTGFQTIEAFSCDQEKSCDLAKSPSIPTELSICTPPNVETETIFLNLFPEFDTISAWSDDSSDYLFENQNHNQKLASLFICQKSAVSQLQQEPFFIELEKKFYGANNPSLVGLKKEIEELYCAIWPSNTLIDLPKTDICNFRFTTRRFFWQIYRFNFMQNRFFNNDAGQTWSNELEQLLSFLFHLEQRSKYLLKGSRKIASCQECLNALRDLFHSIWNTNAYFKKTFAKTAADNPAKLAKQIFERIEQIAKQDHSPNTQNLIEMVIGQHQHAAIVIKRANLAIRH